MFFFSIMSQVSNATDGGCFAKHIIILEHDMTVKGNVENVTHTPILSQISLNLAYQMRHAVRTNSHAGMASASS